MPNAFQTHIIKDTQQKTTIKLVGNFDGASGEESNTVRVRANSLSFALDSSRANLLSGVSNTGNTLPFYGLGLEKVFWSVSGNGNVKISWSAGANSKVLLNLSGSSAYNDSGNWPTIPNATAGDTLSNGDIGIVTSGLNVANANYSIILELRKDNAHYDKGRFADPAAFNAGQYGVSP